MVLRTTRVSFLLLLALGKALCFSSSIAGSRSCQSYFPSISGGGGCRTHRLREAPRQYMVLENITPEFSLVTAAIEVFDGSSITNPVVVSSAYWVNLKAQLTVILIGQLVAILLFAVFATIAVQQTSLVAQELRRDASPKLKIPPPEKNGQPPATFTIDLQKLAICVVIDFLGSASELIPFWGEVADVIFAPVAAYLLRNLFGGSNVAFFIELGEEILPFTDLLPFATICWIIDTFAADSEIASILQLGVFSPSLQQRQAGNDDSDRRGNTQNKEQ